MHLIVTQVEVYGPGIEPGVRVGAPTEFTVDCSKSGPGDVTVNITSAKRKTVPVSINSNGDNTYTVTYEAQVAGPQTIVINLDDVEIPASPIKLDVKPAADLSKVSLIDFEPEAFVDCPNDFIVDTSALPPNATAQVECEISGPDGNNVEVDVTKMGPEGPFQVSYIPTEEGDHEVDLRYDGTPLPDSPYPVTAVHGCNPQKVKAYGDGLEKGIVDEVNTFTIETRNAGTGGLGIAIEGPSEAEMNCTDNKDGTCSVEYVPVEEGDYDIAIKFDDEHIPGSPFQVPVTTKDGKPKVDPSKVKAYGAGLEPENIFPGKPTSFTVDASATGKAPLEVLIGDSNSNDEEGNDTSNEDSGDAGNSRKGSRSKKKKSNLPFDEDEDGYGVGLKQGKGMAALRARSDSLSKKGSIGSEDGLDLTTGDEEDNNNDLRKGSSASSIGGSRKGSRLDILSGGSSRKGSSDSLLGGKSRRNTIAEPVISDKGNGIHEVSYVPPPVGDPYEVSTELSLLLYLANSVIYRVFALIGNRPCYLMMTGKETIHKLGLYLCWTHLLVNDDLCALSSV